MAIKLVKSGGNVTDVAVVNMRCSGTVHPNSVVEFSTTGGAGVNIASASSTGTTIFGVCVDYAEGASDAYVKVIPFVPGQLFQVDCTDAAITAQIGLRHILNAGALLIRNTSTDVSDNTGVFRAVAMTGATSGSGKLIGIFTTNAHPRGETN